MRNVQLGDKENLQIILPQQMRKKIQYLLHMMQNWSNKH